MSLFIKKTSFLDSDNLSFRFKLLRIKIKEKMGKTLSEKDKAFIKHCEKYFDLCKKLN